MITCQFNDSYFPVLDGVGMTAHNYALWLDTLNADSYLIAPKVSNYLSKERYNVLLYNSILLPGMNPYRIGLPGIDLQFKRKMKMINFEILHAHCPFVSGKVALNLSKKLDIPLVATFHSKYREDFKTILDSTFLWKQW